MILPGTYDMTNFTDTLSAQNVTVYKHASYTPVLTINTAGRTYGGLIIPAGSAVTHASTHAFTVSGDVNITGSGALYTGGTGVPTFGSLTIGASGTYSATSGTTTITKNTGTTGVTGRAFYVHTDGIFTHNNALMKFTASDADTQVTGQSVSKNPFYDLEATSGYEPREANETTVLNNATFANNVSFQDSARYIKVLGICRFLGGEYNRGNVSTNANHYFGTLIIEGGVFELSPMEITVGSLRKLGGTIS
jgi:hypothetical protein